MNTEILPFYCHNEYESAKATIEGMERRMAITPLSPIDQAYYNLTLKRMAKYESGRGIPTLEVDEKKPTITLQSFLENNKDYYLTALDNDVMLEVDCKKRKDFPTDAEIAELREMGYVNVLSLTDYTMTCCGIATFIKN